DESLKEPLTLPSIFPNLLVNGSTGIAVGMATNMPPHNLREVVNVFCWLIDNNIEPEDAELNDIMNIMPAPDFPTGGEILGRSGIIEAYSTGRGKITVRGKLHTEESKRGRQSIVITEIPYGVNKTIMLEAMVEAVQNKDIEGVHEMRDESDRDGLRIVIELSRDADSDLITRQLYKHTSLQSTFGVINLALVNGHPEILSLKQLLSIFLNYRRDVVRRRTEHRMKQAKAREHIIEGLKKALTHIEQVIRTIRSTDNAAEAKASLQSVLEFSEAQAQAILDMRLQRLTGLERNKLDDEQSKLLADIAAYTSILEDRKVLDGVIRAELVDLAERFGDDRRTSLSEEPAPETEDYDLIPEEDIIITLSKDGLIKRQPLQSYRLQATGGKGKRGASIHEDDSIEILCVTTTHKDIYFFTNTGRIMSIKGYEIPETRSGKGKPVSRYLPLNLEANERIVNIAGAGDGDFKYAFFITRMGIAKRMSFDELKYTNRAKRIMKLDAGDEIAQVMLTTGNNDVVMVTRNGLALRVSENEFRPLSRTARGVQAIRLKNDDRVLSCDVVDDSRTILVISQFGIGKRVEFSSFMPHHRATTGICLMELTEKTGKLSASLSVKSTDEIIAISSKGRMIRMPVKGINIMKRHSVGVIIIRLDEGDSVADCSFISAEEEDGELTAELPFGDAAEGGDE
ncbi:MAG: DNA gyrase subunit A, partial [Synergistaceae bacterium]|nr:DNA gyrase subunit A [Synergistaceae bacterium]